jgi:hypothetical protein
LMKVSYIVYGTVNSASCPVSQSTERVKIGKGRNKRFENRTTYSASASVNITHTIADVKDGKIWKQDSTGGSSGSSGQTSPISSDQILSFYTGACTEAVREFVKQLVPEVLGQITRIMPDGQVMVSLGRKQGAGSDDNIDFSFYRWVALKDATGQPILDQKGQRVSRKEPIRPLDDSDFCIGRVAKVGDNYSLGDNYAILDVGARKNGFFGGNKWKKSEKHFNALKVGDSVELIVRELR